MEAQMAMTGGGIRALSRTRLGTLVIMGVTAGLIFAVVLVVNQPATNAGGLTSVTLSATATGSAPEVGKTAPDFAALTAEGKPVRLSDFVGQTVWLTFGASWCQPCRAENPDIVAASAKYPGRVAVLQVYLSEDAATVADYVKRVGIPYTAIPDPDTRIAAGYRILGIPSHFFIGADGVLQVMKVGSLSPTAMEAALAGIVK